MSAGTTRAMCTTLLLLAALAAQAGDRHVQLVAETPCLFEYRKWFFTFGRKPEFVPPAGTTVEQCDVARQLHQVIQDELAAEDNEFRAALAKEQLQAAQAASQAAAREAARDRAQEAKERAARAARAKLPGASLGMTPGQVIEATSWGRPERVNRTTSARGISEQWVYPGNQYLYFDNGVLTLMQTSR